MRRASVINDWSSPSHHDRGFGELSGVRVVRIATHPSLQRKGWSSKTHPAFLSYIMSQTQYIIYIYNKPELWIVDYWGYHEWMNQAVTLMSSIIYFSCVAMNLIDGELD
jgi:hypothetical protein